MWQRILTLVATTPHDSRVEYGRLAAVRLPVGTARQVLRSSDLGHALTTVFTATPDWFGAKGAEARPSVVDMDDAHDRSP